MSKYVITERDIRQIIKNVIFKTAGYVALEDGIYEIEDRNQIKLYAGEVWNIMEFSYRDLGGFKSYRNKQELGELVSLLILCVSHHRIVAAATYRDDLGGQKLNGCGTIDGSQNHKEMLKQVIQADIDNLQLWHWVEVSYPLEKWFKEFNGNPIPSQMAPSLLHKAKSKLTFLDDKVHYKRQIGNDPNNIQTKAIYGFNSPQTYEKVMAKLEEFTDFKKYEDFKQYVNSLPKIKEGIDYKDNHTDERIALAIEVVIQFGNLYEEGIYDVSPRMYNWLKVAVQLLGESNVRDKSVMSYYIKGSKYLNIFTPVVLHDYNEAAYVLAPIQ